MKDPQKYNFKPKELLKKITEITASVMSRQEFIESLNNDPDYSDEIYKQVILFLFEGLNQTNCDIFDRQSIFCHAKGLSVIQ